MKPTLVITMGSTGSGKSKLAKAVIDKLKLKNPKFFLIDDYVENDKIYKQKIKKFSKNKNAKSKLRNPDKKTLKYFEKSYFSVRNNGCKKRLTKKRIPKKKCVDLEERGCDRLLSIELNDAILKNQNIIFETKGEYYPKWLIKAINKCNNYNIVIAGVKVSLKNLIKRNKSRSIEGLELFLKDMDTNPAPRLPDISKKSLQNQKRLLNKTLKNIILKGCIKGNKKDIDYCSKYSINRLLIYENDKELKIIYDLNSLKNNRSARRNKLTERKVRN